MEENKMNYTKEERYGIPVSVQLLMMKDDKILLTKRANTGYEDGKYCLPGGHVEKAEEIKEAMIREAEEEIGIKLKKEDLEVYKVLNRKIDKGEYIDFILKSNKWEGEIENREKEKCEEIVWIDKNAIPPNTLSFIPEILKNNKEFYIPYNWEEL